MRENVKLKVAFLSLPLTLGGKSQQGAITTGGRRLLIGTSSTCGHTPLKYFSLGEVMSAWR